MGQEKELVVSHSSLIQLKKGGVLFTAGEMAEHFFLLLKGNVKVYKILSDGSEEEVAFFAPGDIIGDFDFARSAEYDASARVIEDSELIIFPSLDCTMEQLALNDPYTVSKMMMCSIEMMTNRIKSTRKILLKNMSWVKELQRKAYEDPGTGLWKQTFLGDEIDRILEDPTALIMLKPDRFKILVDSRGHDAGDEAMIRIALVLKNITRRLTRGWPMRFKSNETGLLINKCSSSEAQMLAEKLHEEIAALPQVPADGDIPAFPFSGTVVWSVWPKDDKIWNSLKEGSNRLLLDTWKAGGNNVVHYTGEQS
jgi:diguanylate cyclase (GGDEF)-like protein